MSESLCITYHSLPEIQNNIFLHSGPLVTSPQTYNRNVTPNLPLPITCKQALCVYETNGCEIKFHNSNRLSSESQSLSINYPFLAVIASSNLPTFLPQNRNLPPPSISTRNLTSSSKSVRHTSHRFINRTGVCIIPINPPLSVQLPLLHLGPKRGPG